MKIATAGMATLLLFLGGAPGCGTVVHGTRQELKISTAPAGATVTIGSQSCRTPCTLTVERGSQNLLVEKGKYKKTFNIERDFNFGATICGNVCWILPGAIIDIATGSAWEIRPINLRLDASEDSAPAAPSRN